MGRGDFPHTCVISEMHTLATTWLIVESMAQGVGVEEEGPREMAGGAGGCHVMVVGVATADRHNGRERRRVLFCSVAVRE